MANPGNPNPAPSKPRGGSPDWSETGSPRQGNPGNPNPATTKHSGGSPDWSETGSPRRG